jgi:hypothetical protein
LIAMGIFAAGASADDAHGSSAKDGVAGTGTFLQVQGRVHVNAKSGPTGENPRGRFRAAVGTLGVDVRGEVTCLNVKGNAAIISGVIQKSRSEHLLGEGVQIAIRDNHERQARRTPDEFNAGLLPAPLTTCPDPDGSALFPVDRGNFVVHDGVDKGPPGDDDDEGDDDGGDDDREGDWNDLAVQSKNLPTPLALRDDGSLFLP